jgi:hypothetical protein
MLDRHLGATAVSGGVRSGPEPDTRGDQKSGPMNSELEHDGPAGAKARSLLFRKCPL